jgi:hypothetical protein
MGTLRSASTSSSPTSLLLGDRASRSLRRMSICCALAMRLGPNRSCRCSYDGSHPRACRNRPSQSRLGHTCLQHQSPPHPLRSVPAAPYGRSGSAYLRWCTEAATNLLASLTGPPDLRLSALVRPTGISTSSCTLASRSPRRPRLWGGQMSSPSHGVGSLAQRSPSAYLDPHLLACTRHPPILAPAA